MSTAYAEIAPQGRRAATTAKEVRNRYDEAYNAQRWEMQQYATVRAYTGGDQHVAWSRMSNNLVAYSEGDDRTRVTDNRIASNTRIVSAKLLRRPMVFEVLPEASDDSTVRAAALSDAVAWDLAYRQRWDETLRRKALSYLWQSGTAVLSLDWDTKAGEMIAPGVYGGDVVCHASSVAESFAEPGVVDMENSQWWVRAQALPPKVAQLHYGLSTAPRPDVSAFMIPSARTAVGDGRPERPVPLALVLTMYQRPTKGAPGKTCVVIGDEVVTEGDWPFPFSNTLNAVVMRESVVDHRWTGETIVYQAISLQNAVNANISSLVEHAKRAGNARLLVPDLSLDQITELSDLPGEVVPYNSTAGKPEWLAPAQLSTWLVDLGERLDARIDDIMGVHDISRGTTPANIESGVGLSILAESDDTPLGFLAKEMAGGFGRLMSMCLSTYEAKVIEPRAAKVRTPDGVTLRTPWTGADLAGQTTAIVPLEAVIPRSRAAARAEAMEKAKLGLITTLEEWELAADVSPFERLSSRINPAAEKARRENQKMMRGEAALPADFDPHALHIKIHNEQRMSEAYETSPEEIRMMIDDHVTGHEVLAAEEAAKLTMQAAQAPGLAAAATASEPAPLPNGMGMPAGSEAGNMPIQTGGIEEVRR